MYRLLLILSLFFMSGCDSFRAWVAKEFMQDKISDGVARLSVQHLSMIVTELNPKFDSDSAKVSIATSLDPLESGKGTVTWTISNLSLEHPREQVVYTDCLGQQGLWQGKVEIVEATKTIYGRLTKDPKKPVIPDVGQIKITVKARPQGLAIRFPTKDGSLKLNSGELSFIAKPRLATQHSSGMRLVPTSNTLFEDINFEGVNAMLTVKELSMPVSIDRAAMNIQIGVGENGAENAISGSMTIFGNKRDVPRDNNGLDPAYDREQFKATYSCHEELEGRVLYSHDAPEKKLGKGAAALSGSLIAALTGILEEDFDCGMASPDVISQTQIKKSPGQVGHAVSEIARPCPLELNKKVIKPNCFGVAKEISGSVIVLEAKKTLKGLVVTDQENYQKAIKSYSKMLSHDKVKAATMRPKAVLPVNNQPALFSLKLKINNLKMRERCIPAGNLEHPMHCKNRGKDSLKEAPVFKVENALLGAVLKPVTIKSLDEKNPSMNFCAQKSPAGELNIAIEHMRGSIERSGFDLGFSAEGSFSAVNGRIGTRENELRGALKVNGMDVEFKTPEQEFVNLDPNYDYRNFLDSFMSCEKLALAEKEGDCRPELGLGLNVARLLVLNAGSLLRTAASAEIPNSFSSVYALSNSVLSKDQESVTLKASIDKDIDLNNYPTLANTFDNLNTNTKISGNIKELKGTMLRKGIRLHPDRRFVGVNVNFLGFKLVEGMTAYFHDKKEILIRPIVPDSTTVELKSQVKFLKTTVQKFNSPNLDPYIQINQAEFKLKAIPFFGMDKRSKRYEYPSYSIPTPIVKFENIEVNDAILSLVGAGMIIPITVNNATLKAQNGRYGGVGNFIEGSIEMSIGCEGLRIPAPVKVKIKNRTLIPEWPNPYEQSHFDKSYANTEYLKEPLMAD